MTLDTFLRALLRKRCEIMSFFDRKTKRIISIIIMVIIVAMIATMIIPYLI